MDPAYLELLDFNKKLKNELANEISDNRLKDKKLKALTRELEKCYITLSQQDSTILKNEDEITSLKSEIKSLKLRLQEALQNLKYKDEACIAQDIHILRLEENVKQLKQRIRDITDKKLSQNNNLAMATTALNQIIDIATALDRIERYIGGDRSLDPIGNLNLARTTLTHLRAQFLRLGHQTTMDTNTIANLQHQTTTDATIIANLRHMLNNTTTQFNHNLQVVANLRISFQQREQMLTQALRDETNARRQWYQFARDLQTNGQRMAFRKQYRINTLTQDKIALRIIYRRYKADAELAEFNRA